MDRHSSRKLTSAILPKTMLTQSTSAMLPGKHLSYLHKHISSFGENNSFPLCSGSFLQDERRCFTVNRADCKRKLSRSIPIYCGGYDGSKNGASSKNEEFSSSWDAKDALGNDYLYRLGKEADNLRISVGAKEGLIDNVFVGDFLGKDG